MVLNQLQDLKMSQNAHLHNALHSFKIWIISCTMFMTSSPMSTTETTQGMSEGDGS